MERIQRNLRNCFSCLVKGLIAIMIVAVVAVLFVTRPEVRLVLWPPEVPESVRFLRLVYYGAALFWVTGLLDAIAHRSWFDVFKYIALVLFAVFVLPRIVDMTNFWVDSSKLLLGFVGLFIALIIMVGLGEPQYSSSGTATSGNAGLDQATVDKARFEIERKIQQDRNNHPGP
jgi:cytochrome bd-type quinol oxidase subunit 2